MLRWKRVEISAGALLLGAALYYLDEQGVLLMAFCACALHELGHWLVIRALGGRVTALRITCVGAEMRLSARCPLGYWQQIAAALAGPAVNLLAARMAVGLGTEGAYCFAGLNLDEYDRDLERFRAKLSSLDAGDYKDYKIINEREKLVAKIRQLELDVNTYENNIGFIAKSSKSQGLIEELNSKIENTRQRLNLLQEKLKALDSLI